MENGISSLSSQGAKIKHGELLNKTNDEVESFARRRALKSISGAALGIGAFGLITHQQGLLQSITADYSASSVAKQITLEDESQLWLNVNSAIEVDFNTAHRQIKLTKGELQLSAVEESRPMTLTVSQGIIETNGATLSLRNESHHAVVQVDEGQVNVSLFDGMQSIQVVAGQVVKLNHKALEFLNKHIFDYSSWVEGVLSVRNITLQSLIDEVSRYHMGFIRCHSSLKQQLISGVFQLSDTDLLIQFIPST